MSRVIVEGGPRRIVPGAKVRYDAQPVRVPVGRDDRVDVPQLRIAREQDQITAIEITCTCGCQLRLVCDYDES